MERAFDREMADLIRGFTGDLGKVVRELIAQNRSLKGENARLKAKLQGVRDQVMDVPETVPDADEIAARGTQHQSVNDDIRESAVNLEAMEAEIAQATDVKQAGRLVMLLDHLRPNSPSREPLDDFPSEPRVVQA